MIREEGRRDAHRRVPRELVVQEGPGAQVAERGPQAAPAGGAALADGGRLVLAEQQRQAREAGQAGDRGQRGERDPGEAQRGQAIEGHRGGERGERARDAQEDRPLAEVAPPQAAGDELAHPRDPRAVADHAEDRADRHDPDEEAKLRGGRDVEPGEPDQGQEGEARDAHREDRRQLAAVGADEPRGGQARDLGHQRQRAEEADERGARPEVERPAGDDRAGGAGGEDLGARALREGRAERPAQRPRRGGAHAHPVGRRGGGQRRARSGHGLARLGDREGGSESGQGGEDDRGAKHSHCGHFSFGVMAAVTGYCTFEATDRPLDSREFRAARAA